MKKSMGGLENDDLASISKRVKLKEDILTATSRIKPQGNLGKRTDYSAFRTPSGQYYCAACNLSLNSDSQFGQHQVRPGLDCEDGRFSDLIPFLFQTSKKHKQREISQRSRKK